ncbi:hypothetical protein Syun_020451 [Stephania yunnanensis]|uniref:Uncharacterized protein n=1 Tax=Stephania yunnanensis TaxID=152371 RepID=A0AAP0IDT5_9MAGN
MIESSVKFFLQRLTNLLLQNPEIFLGLQDQIINIKSILSEKIWYFEEINIRIEKECRVALAWIQELRVSIHSIDDCIDEFIVQVKNRNGSDRNSLIDEFKIRLEQIGSRIGEIMNRMPGNTERVSMEGMAFSSSMTSNSDSNYVLPYYLHSCLMYCCVFPESYQITKGRLVRLLVSEGLVQEKIGETMEDVAKENIESLINLGLLVLVESKSDERPRFQVDPQFRVLVHRKMEEEGFIASCGISVESNDVIGSNVRRVSIHVDAMNIPNDLNGARVRSIFMFGIEGRLTEEAGFDRLREFLLGVKLLRVLDLEDVKLRTLPDEVGDLIHLSYLSVKNSDIEELPASIGNLRNLQTLDIRWNGKLVKTLPVGILNLIQLRHLKMLKNSGVCGMVVPGEGIGKLKNLQAVTGLYAGEGVAGELGCLSQLRRLGVMDFTEDIASELFVSIAKMENLLSLSLEPKHGNINGDMLPPLEPFTPPPLLQKLRLEGQLGTIPNWFGSMQNLMKLRLGFTHLTENPTQVLQFLPNLRRLSLWQAYDAKQIGKEFCVAGGFPKLEFLTIASHVLEEWSELEEGALPSLKCLHLHSCLKLRKLPEGLQNVTTLQRLNLYPLLDDHEERLRPDGGAENYKIKHIPVISFITTSRVNSLVSRDSS